MAHEFYDNPQAHPYADFLHTQTVTLVGGGGGNKAGAEALAPYVGELNVVVGVADAGGATIKNTNEHGVVPSGDMARVTHALSCHRVLLTNFGTEQQPFGFDGEHARFGATDDHETVRSVGTAMLEALKQAGHEFDDTTAKDMVAQSAEVAKMAIGGIQGRKLSGLMYTGLMSKKLMGHHVNKATQIMGGIVGARGNILAVSDTIHNIVAEYYDPVLKRMVRLDNEDDIDEQGIPYPLQTTLTLDRPIVPNEVAVAAVRDADWTLFAQGSPWGSILPPGLALKEGLQERARLGRKIGGILNLVEDNGSVGLTADQHGLLITSHLDIQLDASIYNSRPEAIPSDWTAVQGTPSVPYAVGVELSGAVVSYSANDAVAAKGLRSPVETDPRALALGMMDLLQMQHEDRLIRA